MSDIGRIVGKSCAYLMLVLGAIVLIGLVVMCLFVAFKCSPPLTVGLVVLVVIFVFGMNYLCHRELEDDE